MKRRFAKLESVIRISVVSEDALGLASNPMDRRVTVLQEMTSSGRRAFAYPRNSRKISAFMDWLKRQMEAGIISVADYNQVGEAVEAAWQNKYIYRAYASGVTKARQQLIQAGFDVPSLSDSGGLGAVLAIPIHLDRLGVLYTRAFNELRGITAVMDQLLSRVLTTGLAEGWGMIEIARALIHAVSGEGSTLDLPISYVNPRTGKLVNYVMPGKQRALILTRTEIIRAHAHGQLQEFKNWGVLGVGVLAELATAGDPRVCEICASLEGRTFTIEEAFGVIPVHPQCRCVWLPYLTD